MRGSKRSGLTLVLVFFVGVMTGLLARPRLADLLRPQYQALRGRFLGPEHLGPAPGRMMSGVEITPSPIPRFEAAAAVVGEKLYLLGGFYTLDLNASSQCDVYEPASDSWTRLADTPLPVTHAGVAVVNDEIWVVGGFAGDHPGPATAEVWRYNVAGNVWTPGPPLPEPRGSGALVELDGELHFFGGVKTDRDTDAPDHWVLRLDEVPAAWQPRAPMLHARNHLSGAAVNGKIHAVGGQYRHDFAPLDLDLHEAYDPATDSWTRLAPLLRARSHSEPGTFVHEGLIIIAGGRSNQTQVLYDIDAYDPVSDRWRSLPALRIPMRAPVAKLAGNQLIAGAGGMLPNGIVPTDRLFSFPIHELDLSGSPAAGQSAPSQ